MGASPEKKEKKNTHTITTSQQTPQMSSTKRSKTSPSLSTTKRTTLHLSPVHTKQAFYSTGKVSCTSSGTLLCLRDGAVLSVDAGKRAKAHASLGGEDEVVCFAVSPGGTLATCSRRGLIRVYDENRKELKSFASGHVGTVGEMDFDPTGECLATGASDKLVKVFSTSGGYVSHNFKGHKDVVTAVKFHPNEGNLTLATADATGLVALWDLRTKKQTWFKNHMSAVPGLAFLGQNHLISVGRDRILTVWSKDKPEAPVKTVPAYESLETVLVLDAKHFVTGGSAGVLKKWKVDKMTNECSALEDVDLYGNSTRAVGDDEIDSISRLLPFGNNAVLAVSSVESIFTFRDAADLNKRVQSDAVGFDDEVFDVAFVKSNVLLVGTNSPLIREYTFDLSATDGETVVSVRFGAGHTAAVLCVASSDNYFVSGSKDQTARVWDAVTLKCLSVCQGHTDAVGACAIANKTPSLFATGSDDTTLRLWCKSSKTGEIKCTDQRGVHSKPIMDVCFSPNDEIVATASADKTCKLWNIAAGTMGNEAATIIGLACELKGHKRAVNTVRFSPVDRVVCTSSTDTTLRVWAIADGSCVRTLEGHTSPVTCALFGRSGMSLVSSGGDGAIKTWDLKASTVDQTLFGGVTTDELEGSIAAPAAMAALGANEEVGHADRVWSMASFFDQDDKTNTLFASVGTGGRIIIWRDDTEEEWESRSNDSKALLLSKQELDTSIREKRFLDAAKLALKLNRPHQLRVILDAVSADPANHSVESMHEFIMQVLNGSETGGATMLDALIAWNGIARTCMVAQRCVAACLYRPKELEAIVGKEKMVRFAKSALPYTQRHFDRVERLLRSSYSLDVATSLLEGGL